jgi:hypothetical protein
VATCQRDGPTYPAVGDAIDQWFGRSFWDTESLTPTTDTIGVVPKSALHRFGAAQDVYRRGTGCSRSAAGDAADECAPIAGTSLGEDRLQVVLYGVLRHKHRIGDGPSVGTINEQVDQFAFA